MRQFIDKMYEELNEQGETEASSRLMFTGNGFNMIQENYYPEKSHDLEDINQLRDKFLETIDDVSQMVEYEFIHTKRYAWNNNMKIPHTFHFKIPCRLSRLITVEDLRNKYGKAN